MYNDECIYVRYKGQEYVESNSDWLSPKASAFLRFCYKFDDKDESIKNIKDFIYHRTNLVERYEKLLCGNINSSRHSTDKVMNMTVNDAEKELNKFLNEFKYKNITIWKFGDYSTYDHEYENPSETDLVCDKLLDMLGWHINGNPWNDSLIDEQRMEIAMHQQHNGGLAYNWYMIFKHPDFLNDRIDLDKMFDDAAREIAEEQIQYEEFA